MNVTGASHYLYIYNMKKTAQKPDANQSAKSLVDFATGQPGAKKPKPAKQTIKLIPSKNGTKK